MHVCITNYRLSLVRMSSRFILLVVCLALLYGHAVSAPAPLDSLDSDQSVESEDVISHLSTRSTAVNSRHMYWLFLLSVIMIYEEMCHTYKLSISSISLLHHEFYGTRPTPTPWNCMPYNRLPLMYKSACL